MKKEIKQKLKTNIDDTLRPKKLDHFIGHENIKEGLRIFIEAAVKRKEPLTHVLLSGAPGLGKTTLAQIIAREMGVNYKITSGPALLRPGDLVSILTNLDEGDVLFIDEIHRLNKTIEETLYPAMEDSAVDIILGKGPTAQMLRLDLPKFTLVGATTRSGSLSKPFRERFGIYYQLDFYELDDLAKIIKRSANILKIKIDNDGVLEIAKRSRKTPRIANRILHRVRDYAEVRGNGSIDLDISKKALDIINIDQHGLDEIDRKILTAIATKFNGGPVGVKTLSAAIHEDTETIESVIEPYLLQIGFLDRTSSGRKLTANGYQYLDKLNKR